ncbi:MAG: sugar ABC transporter permease [Eubacteriales bacterium]|nr:sugar ABC transporter permease [Eubacteriales bacterium]
MNKKTYPIRMAIPGLLIYLIIFVIPTFASFYFSMTRWNLRTSEFTGLENYVTFFTMTSTKSALKNTAIYASVCCLAKLILGLLLARYVCSGVRSGNYLKILIFFPTLLGNVVTATAFQSILEPNGIVNQVLAVFGIPTVRFLTDKRLALATCCVIDIWQGLGTATIIFIAGLSAIPRDYYEAASIDGARDFQVFRKITLPLMVPSINTVLTLSLIGGIRTYDLIYTLTGGGPGYATEVMGSVVYKLFSRGSYGLATTGNVIIFVIVSVIVFPLNAFVSRWEEQL